MQLDYFENKLCNDEYLVLVVKIINMRRDNPRYLHIMIKNSSTIYKRIHSIFQCINYVFKRLHKNLLQMRVQVYQIILLKDVIYNQNLNKLVYNKEAEIK